MSKVIHTCTGCIPIDKSIIDVYVALLSADKSVTEAETARVEAENARIAAETARDLAESSRKSAEDAREATSSSDHATAVADHITAEEDHTIAVAGHATASADHTLSTEATAAANVATTRANEAADAAEHMVDIHRGPKGDQGNTGSSVDYPYELVNNVTTDDATKGLSAAQGVVLDGKISQLGQQVDNPEWVRVVTDANDRILYGVKTNGKFYFGDGCPPQVVEYVLDKISELSLDEYGDIVTFLGDLVGGDTLATLLNNKVDKVEGKSVIDADYADSQSAIDNPEYQQVTTDSEGKVLLGIKANGEIYIPLLEGRNKIQTEIAQLTSWSDKIPPLLQRKNVPAISWIDDDFLITQEAASYNILRTWCNAHNIHLDFAAIPSVEYTDETQVDIRRIYFNEAQLQAIRDYENEGFQFVVHPIHHGLYGENLLGERYIRKNLHLCQKAFRENIIGNSDIFVYAGASSGTPGMLKVVKELYDCAFTPDINRPIIGVERDRYHLSRCGIEISAQHTVSQIKAEIDDAISKGAWIVLLTHIYNYTGDGTEPTDETSMSMSNLFDIVTYANSKIPIVSTSEIWRERKIIWEYYQ